MEEFGAKPLFTISIAAKIIGLHPRTLMLYEKEKLITPYRTPTNRRLYSQNDLKTIHFIKYLTQEEGLNLKGVTAVFQALKIARENNLKLRRRLFPNYSPPKSLLA